MDLPKMTASVTISNKGDADILYTYLGEVPKEIMDEFKNIIGDGMAKVSVSVDLSIKDYGTGASAMASVTLSCNQDMQTIQRASELAAWAAKKFASQYRGEAEGELEKILQEKAGHATVARPHFG
jgi:hypothetical protein